MPRLLDDPKPGLCDGLIEKKLSDRASTSEPIETWAGAGSSAGAAAKPVGFHKPLYAEHPAATHTGGCKRYAVASPHPRHLYKADCGFVSASGSDLGLTLSSKGTLK